MINSYPNINGRMMGDPTDDHIDSISHQYFALNDKAIITIIDLPEDNTCRLVIRDLTGKHCWDMQPFFHDINEMEGKEMPPTKPNPDVAYPSSTFLNGL